MGCGLVSHFSRKPALNLLPEYQSSGPFFASWSLIVFSEAGPAIWWQEAHLPASKAFFPSATPASAPDETNSAMSTVITETITADLIRSPLKTGGLKGNSKIGYFFRGRGRAKIKSGAYMRIREHFYFLPNKETGEKEQF